MSSSSELDESAFDLCGSADDEPVEQVQRIGFEQAAAYREHVRVLVGDEREWLF